MIASIFGTIRELKVDSAVVEANGIGYRVFLTAKNASQLSVGNDYRFATSMVVREDSMTLYGFNSSAERDLFELLQTVSGIGPKVALVITGAMSYDDLAIAISNKDEKALSALPGIGKKGAQRLILELENKIQTRGIPIGSSQIGWRSKLVDALESLGFTHRESESAINVLISENDSKVLSDLDEAELLKKALAATRGQKGLSK